MAVTGVKNPSSLKLKFDLGTVDGKKKSRTKSYSHLRPDATVENVYDVGVGLASLQEHIIMDICKVDNTSISE